MLSGPVTTVPLLFFGGATRRLRLSTMGFIQYLSPSLQFLLAVLVFGEPFSSPQVLSFACIWTAILIYVLDSLRRAQQDRIEVVEPDRRRGVEYDRVAKALPLPRPSVDFCPNLRRAFLFWVPYGSDRTEPIAARRRLRHCGLRSLGIDPAVLQVGGAGRPPEVLAHRAWWSFALLAICVYLLGRWNDLWRRLHDGKAASMLAMTAC